MDILDPQGNSVRLSVVVVDYPEQPHRSMFISGVLDDSRLFDDGRIDTVSLALSRLSAWADHTDVERSGWIGHGGAVLGRTEQGEYLIAANVAPDRVDDETTMPSAVRAGVFGFDDHDRRSKAEPDLGWNLPA